MPAAVVVLVIAGCAVTAVALAWVLSALLSARDGQGGGPDFRLRHRRNRGNRR